MKAKTIILVLLIVAALGAVGYWFFKSKKKSSDNNQYNEPDNSENADLAQLSTNQAIALVNEHKNECRLNSDTGDAPEYKYVLSVEPAGKESKSYFISERTFKALLDLGLFAEYN